MKKVVLVAINSSYNHTNLALRYIREKLLEKNLKELDIVFIEKTVNELWLTLFETILNEKADVYVFSCYIWNRELVESLSFNLKRIYPNTKILWGGPDASSQAEQLLKQNPQVDVIVCGEGDSVTADWVVAQLFPALSFLAPDTFEPNTRLLQASEELHWKFPYTAKELKELNERILYYEGSRGCAYKCTYCLSGNTLTARHKPLNEVFMELSYIMSFNPRQLKFIDRTFNSDPQRAFQIWQFLIEKSEQLPVRTNFHFEIAAELLTRQQLDLLAKAKAGLFQFEIGAQTVNADVLKSIKRPFHPEKFKRIVSELRDMENIHIHLDLIAGLPGETLKSQIKSANYLLDLEPNMLQMGFLKILPATPIKFESDKRRMIYQNFPPYEILQSDEISAEELMFWRKLEQVVEIYYNSGQYFYCINLLLALVKEPFSIFMELQYFIEQNYGQRKISQHERYAVLADFIKKEICLYFYSNPSANKQVTLQPFAEKFMQHPDLFEMTAIDALKVDYFKKGMKSYPAWFSHGEKHKNTAADQVKTILRTAFAEKHYQQRIRYETFSFSLQNLPGLEHLILGKNPARQKESAGVSGAGETQATRKRFIRYLDKEIMKNKTYMVAFQLSNPPFYILAEREIEEKEKRGIQFSSIT